MTSPSPDILDQLDRQALDSWGDTMSFPMERPFAQFVAGLIDAYPSLAAELRSLRAERDRLKDEVKEAKGLLKSCSDDLEAEIEARRSGELPRRIERDLAPVREARAFLAKHGETK